jgi:heme-degrading monooxygenase HmoA
MTGAGVHGRGHSGVMNDQKAVVRIWGGVVRTEDSDTYVEYVERTGMAAYRTTPGNLDAWLLTRDLGDGRTEVTTISRWDSLEAITRFAGADIENAVFYPEDDRYLVARDDRVRHYRQRT